MEKVTTELYETENNISKSNNKKKLIAILLAIVLLMAVVMAAFKWRSQINEYKDNINLRDQQISELQKKVNSLDTKNSSDSQQYITVRGGGVSISVKNEKNWSVATNTHEAPLYPGATTTEAQNSTITSPDGLAIIKINTGIDGIGGACLPEENPNITQINSTSLSGSPGYSFVQYNTRDGRYEAAVMKNEDIKSVKVGNNVCDLAFDSFIGLPDAGHGIFQIKITSTVLDKYMQANNKQPEEQEVINFFKSNSFKAAKELVLSSKINISK